MTRTENIKSKKVSEIEYINIYLKRMTLQELSQVSMFVSLGYTKKSIEAQKNRKNDLKLVKQGKLEWSNARSAYIKF